MTAGAVGSIRRNDVAGKGSGDLFRAVPLAQFRTGDGLSGAGDGLTFTGYGAVFNTPTRIDSWEGLFDEQLAPGAFVKSLRERTPKFQFDHGRHSMLGSVPIGVITDIHEDGHGLYVEARLGQHMLIDLVREAIATGAVDGMSFRFEVVREEWRDTNGRRVAPEDVRRILYYGEQPERAPLLRTLKEVNVSEVGPVVWPAYPTTTAAVRTHPTGAPKLSRAVARRRLQLLEFGRKAK
ncbi:HK97 family phage prohead protease [Mycolicibacterium sp. jd]|uniref:HK97 family phage prohead protease n=1 Tax=unclassified Mycolicibacterium TaxID=2636767 RepID=UPI00351BB864